MFFRDQVAKVSLGDMLEIQERLGTKKFRKALQENPIDSDEEQEENDKDEEDDDQVIEDNQKKQSVKNLKNSQRDKSAPLEVSSKRRPLKRESIPVHLRGKGKTIDPRFNENFGDYDAKEFRESYHFITDLRREELKTLRKQLKSCEDPNEKTKLKTVINRLKSQVKNVDDLDRVEKISKDMKKKSEELAQDGQSTPYITKKVRKVVKLASTYTDLKNTGRLDAYLNKKRKRLASKKRKEMPTRRVQEE